MSAPRVRASALLPLSVLVLVVCGLLSLTAVTMEVGLRGVLPGLALAAVPVGPVLATVLWLDRHEAEPRTCSPSRSAGAPASRAWARSS